jgi:hypothetical protein
MKNKISHVTAVLHIPEVIALLLALAKAVAEAITNNKLTFVTPTPSVAQVKTDIDALDTAETATKTKALGTVQTRDDKKKAVVNDLHQWKSYVQQVADQNPDHAESIIVAAGMTVRKKGVRTKSDLVAKAAVAGSVHLVAKAAKGNRSHEWQYSTDGKTWTNAPPSTKPATVIANLQSGVLTYFRHRSVTTAGVGDWSAPVSIAVS